MSHFIDLTGQRFGRWTVIGLAPKSAAGQTRWRCVCDCGREKIVQGGSLRSGSSLACGCVSRETHRNNRKPKVPHKKPDRIYSVWIGMKSRCYNQKSNSYKYYGGRGIKVCDEWLHDPDAFIEWSLSHGYDPSAKRGECTLDRIDVNGDYSPDNCRWVSMMVQAHNKRQ